jgi:Flp pilus assembly protein TadD
MARQHSNNKNRKKNKAKPDKVKAVLPAQPEQHSSATPLAASEKFTQDLTPQTHLESWLRQLTVVWFHFLVLTVPFFFVWVNEELFEFNKMLLTYAITLCIVGTWIIRMLVAQKIVWRRTPFELPIAAFVLTQLLSTLFSIDFHTSLYGYYTRFHGGFLSTLTYAALYFAFVSNVTRKDLPRLGITTFMAATGVSIYASLEHFGHSLSCYFITKEFNASCWIQDVQSRVFATFGQPNWLAAYLITLLPLSLGWVIQAQPAETETKLRKPSQVSLLSFPQAVLLLLSTLFFETLLYTKSRSGFLGVAIGLAGVFGFAAVSKIWTFKNQPNLVMRSLLLPLLAGVLFVAVSLSIGTPFTPSFQQFIQSRQTTANQEFLAGAQPENNPSAPPQAVNRLEEGGTDSGDIRKIVWSGALKVWQRYPYLGSGVETFAYSYYLDRPAEHNLVSEWDFLYNKAHNEFLNFLATTGALGLLAYCVLLAAFIGLPLLHSVRTYLQTQNYQQTWLGIAVGSALVALSISNFFGFSTVMVTILLFLLPASWVIFTQEYSSAETATKSRYQASNVDGTQWLGFAGVGIVVIMGLSSVWNMWKADALYVQGKGLIEANQVGAGVDALTQATEIAPKEALFLDELSYTYARVAANFANQGNASQAAQLAQAAIAGSNQVLQLNSVHLNFYKSRARLFIALAELDPEYLRDSLKALEEAQRRAPTDAKVMYNRALIELQLGNQNAGMATLEATVKLKPNYEAAYFTLGQQYAILNRVDEARQAYQHILDTINPTNQQVLQALEKLP